MASDGDYEREDQGKDSRHPCVASGPSASPRGSRPGPTGGGLHQRGGSGGRVQSLRRGHTGVFRRRVPVRRDGRHRQEHYPSRRGQTRGRGRSRAGRAE